MKLFFFILLAAVGQDLKSRSVGARFLLLASGLGVGFCIYDGRDWKGILCSVMVGFAVLAFSWVTRGKIGAGDGWFFVISGLFLGFKENLALAVSGLFFCSLYCLVFAAAALWGGGNIRSRRVPFLPFLIPVGLWLVFL